MTGWQLQNKKPRKGYLFPTKREDYTISKVDDYGSKGSITAWISEIGRLP
jgi:hypothetical protein